MDLDRRFALPVRPRSHELEERSRQRFVTALPTDRALARPRPAPEYGIDLDVELVESERMTGMEFSVQVKSTDRAGNRPTATVALSTLNYWRQMSRLVLLVLWDEESERLWCRWAHHIDTRDVREGQKTLAVAFDAADLFGPRTFDELEAEVRARRSWASAADSIPLSLEIRASGTLGAQAAGLVKSALTRALRQYGDLLRAGSTGRPGFVALLAGDQIEIVLRGGPSAVLHYPKSQADRKYLSVERVVSDAILVIALQMTRLNLHAFAARLIADHWRSSTMAYQGLLAPCARTLLADNRLNEAIALARTVDDRLDSDIPVNLAMLSMEELGADARVRVARELRDWAERRGDAGDPEAVAFTLNRAAELLIAEHPALAYAAVTEAGELSPSLHDDASWQRRRAGAAFLAGRYGDAADCYELARAAGATGIEPLLGDALIWAGQLSRAIPLLSGSPGPDCEPEPEFQLKARCFGVLQRALGIGAQVRDSERATEVWWGGEPSPARCREALEADFLCPPALSWLASALLWGVEASDESWFEEGSLLVSCAGGWFDIALCAAFSIPGLPGVWESLLLNCPVGEQDAHEKVLIVAQRMCGEEIAQYFWVEGLSAEAEMIEEAFARAGRT